VTVDHTHNPHVERAVLSSVLDGRIPGAWDMVMEIISTPLAFYGRNNQIVALACCQVAVEGAKVEAQAVMATLAGMRFGDAIQRLRDYAGLKGKLPPSEGASYEDSALMAIGGFNSEALDITLVSTITPTQLRRNAEILAGHHRQRVLLAAMTQGVNDLKGPAAVKTAPEILERVISACTAQTAEQAGHIEVRPALIDHDAAKTAGVLPRGACYGITALDEQIALGRGELWTLAANTGCGKTSLLLHALTATAEMHGPGSVAICSQEMGRKELAQIYIARRLKIARKAVKDGQMTNAQRAMGDEVEAWLDPLRIAIRDSGKANVNDVVAWSHSRKRICPNLSLVAIDYLGLLRPTNPRHTDYEKFTEATRTLKQLARELNVTVLLLAQMNNESRKVERNRDGTLRRPPEPQTTDLKGSGSIGDDSDGVMFLWRPSDDATLIEAKVTKCRADAPPRIALRWTPWEGQRFSDPNQTEPHSSGRTRHDRITNPEPNVEPPF
jgi:replicative DNA helicase